MEVGARDVQGLPLFAQLAPRQSYASMAGKPAPSSHKSPRQRNQVPVTPTCQWKNKGVGGRGGGRDGGRTNDLKAKRREWPPGKRCTEHMEVMQARLTALEPNH